MLVWIGLVAVALSIGGVARAGRDPAPSSSQASQSVVGGGCTPQIGVGREFLWQQPLTVYGWLEGDCPSLPAPHVVMTPLIPFSGGPSGAGDPYAAQALFGARGVYAWGTVADRPRTWQLVWGSGPDALRSAAVAVKVHANFVLDWAGRGKLDFHATSPDVQYAKGAEIWVDRLFWWGWTTTQRIKLGKLSGMRSRRIRVKPTPNAVRVVVLDTAMAGGWLGGQTEPVAPG